MHKVRGLKILSVSFVMASALNYFAAFNMVGWNFLVPGRYTFGIVCTIFIVVISLAALLWLADSTPADSLFAGAGFALALVVISSLINAEVIKLKDYFIWGFFPAVPVALLAAVLLIHLRHSLGTIRVSRGLFRATPLWASALAVYAVSTRLDVMQDLQRFHRQQIYLLGAATITAAALLQMSKILSWRKG